VNIIQVGTNLHTRKNNKRPSHIFSIALSALIVFIVFLPTKAVITTNGISLFGTAVSSGTVEATEFCTGDGETNCVSDFSTLTPALRDTARNLIIKNNASNPLYQVDIDADEVILQNSSNVAKRVDNVNLTVSITTSGAGGIDTGSESSSTWYHIWVISDGTTTSSLLSTSYTSPTMPSGYTYKAYLGAIYNNASSNLIQIYQQGKTASTEPITALSGAYQVSYTSFSLAAAVPPNASFVHADAGMNKTYYTWSRQGGYFKPSSSSTIGETVLIAYTEAVGGNASYDGEEAWQVKIPLIESQTMYYKCYNSLGLNTTYCNNTASHPGGTGILFRVTGWDLP
jgi:hypothetical protein